ncbi:hypothetical protein NOCA2480063 [metagenome]|uniref:Uncharacterized protein n=1 Tax=metagenome TaxID=256318 RepID=A0A2P2C7Q3_9ZZZZ
MRAETAAPVVQLTGNVGSHLHHRSMTEPATDPDTQKTFGDVVPPRSHETSAIEKQVRGFLRDAGYAVPKRGVLCQHPGAGKTFPTLTPDMIGEEWRTAVEVDPCSPVRIHGSSHHGEGTSSF